MFSQTAIAVNAEHRAATVFSKNHNNYRVIYYNIYCFFNPYAKLCDNRHAITLR